MALDARVEGCAVGAPPAVLVVAEGAGVADLDGMMGDFGNMALLDKEPDGLALPTGLPVGLAVGAIAKCSIIGPYS